MRGNAPEGFCHICGSYGPLSFEHVPPRRAFNDRRVVRIQFMEAIELGPDTPTKGHIQQRGAGEYTLCASCNNKTGSWYAPHFIAWCYQGMEILQRSGGSPSLFYLNYLLPLPIIKQVITMFFSVNPYEFAHRNEDLVRFVLNRELMYLPDRFRVFTYYMTGGKHRYMGVSARLNLRSRQMNIMSEISYPPFGYLLSIDSPPPDQRLVEITHFSRYQHNEFAVMELRLPPLETHLVYPGDYRSKDEIIQQAGDQSELNSA